MVCGRTMVTSANRWPVVRSAFRTSLNPTEPFHLTLVNQRIFTHHKGGMTSPSSIVTLLMSIIVKLPHNWSRATSAVLPSMSYDHIASFVIACDVSYVDSQSLAGCRCAIVCAQLCK